MKYLCIYFDRIDFVKINWRLYLILKTLFFIKFLLTYAVLKTWKLPLVLNFWNYCQTFFYETVKFVVGIFVQYDLFKNCIIYNVLYHKQQIGIRSYLQI